MQTDGALVKQALNDIVPFVRAHWDYRKVVRAATELQIITERYNQPSRACILILFLDDVCQVKQDRSAHTHLNRMHSPYKRAPAKETEETADDNTNVSDRKRETL